MGDLIGRDGLPLQIQGMAVPFNEWIELRDGPECFLPNAFSRQFAEGQWCDGVKLEWGHDDMVVAEEQRMAVLSDGYALWFRVTLPASPQGRHVSLCARSGELAASVEFYPLGHRPDGGVRSARLKAIGLGFDVAYDTACWLSDDETVPTETKDAWRRFHIADMTATASRYTPPPSRPVKVAESRVRHEQPRPANDRENNYRAAQAFARAVRSGAMDRETAEMLRLCGR